MPKIQEIPLTGPWVGFNLFPLKVIYFSPNNSQIKCKNMNENYEKMETLNCIICTELSRFNKQTRHGHGQGSTTLNPSTIGAVS